MSRYSKMHLIVAGLREGKKSNRDVTCEGATMWIGPTSVSSPQHQRKNGGGDGGEDGANAATPLPLLCCPTRSP